jgi:hypothetical protein
MRFLSSWFVVLGVVVALCDCSGNTSCEIGNARCDGAELQTCVGHPGGPTGGGLGDVSYQKGSSPSWMKEAECGQGLCISSGQDAFCALDPAPLSACPATASGPACDGTTLLNCTDGYPVQRKLCKTCDVTKGVGNACYVSASGASDCCPGGVESPCQADPDCANGLRCIESRCAMPCDCEEGQPCPACDALYEDSTNLAVSVIPVWRCHSQLCLQY